MSRVTPLNTSSAFKCSGVEVVIIKIKASHIKEKLFISRPCFFPPKCIQSCSNFSYSHRDAVQSKSKKNNPVPCSSIYSCHALFLSRRQCHLWCGAARTLRNAFSLCGVFAYMCFSTRSFLCKHIADSAADQVMAHFSLVPPWVLTFTVYDCGRCLQFDFMALSKRWLSRMNILSVSQRRASKANNKATLNGFDSELRAQRYIYIIVLVDVV